MKKLIFSAAIVLAFVGTSLAKTGEVEVKTVDQVLKLHPCVYEGFAASDAVADMGGTGEQQVAAATKAYNKCMAR